MALIMIADDSEEFAAALEGHLVRKNHQVFIAKDGFAASLKAQENHPELIIMDIHMPGVYGPTAFKTLEESGLTRTTPVIFVTALSKPEADKLVLLPVAAKARLLFKPLDFAKLDATISELLA